MFKLLKNKFVWLPILVALFIGAYFSITAIPSTHMKVNDLPIAIVNEDQGTTGKNLTKQITTKNTSKSTKNINKLSFYNSQDYLLKEMNKEKYYGAIVIPKNFSANLQSLMTPNPKKDKLKIIINQGMGTTITTQVNTTLTEMTHQINTALGKQLLQTLSKKMPAIPAEMASNLTNPLTIETEKINKTGAIFSIFTLQ